MPYLQLRNSSLSYQYVSRGDRLIVSGIVDSGCSYESPILIRTKKELDIYFGRNFPERAYFNELLEDGVSLLLFKPTSSIKKVTAEDIKIPVEKATDKEGKDFLCADEFPKVGDKDLLYVDSFTGEEYIWYEDLSEYVKVKDLPQNLDILENLESWNNRDTLRICDKRLNLSGDPENEFIPVVCYPRYQSEYPVKLNEESKNQLPENLVVGKNHFQEIIDNERGFAFSFDFTNIDFFREKEEADYICLLKPSDLGVNFDEERILIWFNSGSDRIPLGSDIVKLDHVFEVSLSDFKDNDDLIEEVKKILKENSFEVVENIDKNNFTIYSEVDSIRNSVFSNILGLRISLNQTLTHDILSQGTEDFKRIEFYSKTVGPNDEPIKIKIDPVDYYSHKYRITISRFNYTEYYTLNLFDEPDRDGNIQSLDGIINKSSKLVRCHVFREKSDGTKWTSGDKECGLPTGEWILGRAYYENPTPEMYWNSLKYLKDIEELKEDFLCIPEIELYLRKDKKDYEKLGYFLEYEDLLDYASTKNCQVLIGNLNYGLHEGLPGINEDPQERMIYELSDKTYKIFWRGEYRDLDISEDSLILKWGNSFVYNYNRDYDNRLVYFFRDFSLSGLYPRPAYYVFLKGILSDKYSVSLDNISYQSPIKNAYLEESFEKAFMVKKTNYMVFNDHEYYYKNFQNHPGNGIYMTTILTRFALGKVSRQLMNNKWKLLGKTSVGEIKNSVSEILNHLTSGFDLYKNISIIDFSVNQVEHSVTIRLNVYLRELVDKPISLDVELNQLY